MVVVPPELRLNCALTVVFAFRVNAQEPVPVQVPPLQPTNVLPAAALAVRDTAEPGVKDSVQVLPQLMAPPQPSGCMPQFLPVGVGVKLAMTFLAEFMVTVHVPVPEQSPAHPEKL